MTLRIGIEQPPDHTLVLRVMFPRFILEELDALFAQRDRDFNTFVPKNEFLRARQEVRNDLEVAEGFVRVFDFLAHKFSCLSASSRPRKFE